MKSGDLMGAMPQPTVGEAPRRNRIGVLVTTPATGRPGGVAQYMRNLRSCLPDEVQYFTVGSRSDNERLDATLLRVVRDAWRFAHTLRHGSYDVVHLNPSLLPKSLLRDGVLLVIAKALGKAVVVFVHGWDDACERVLSTRLLRLFRLVYGRADAFIVLGNEFKKRLRLLGYEGTIFVQGAPIEDELLADCQQQRVRRCVRGSFPKFTVLFLARVEKEKGIYEALDAYRLLKQEHPFVSLIVAGNGSQLNLAVRYACSRHLDDVSFIGHVEQGAKYEAFRMADAYLFPSYTEGLPISVLEAMAYGLPVVTCAVGGLRDFFQDGRMGFMTESPDPKVLASLMSRLIREPSLCSRMSLLNRNYALDHFTSKQIADRLEGVYRFVFDGADRTLLCA